MGVSLAFLGGAGTVTGSKYLVRHGGQALLVDCGLFQGYKLLRERNWQPLPVASAAIDAVLLTHAHLDHSGYLPLLARGGFAGAVHCTEATRDLCAILLPDSGHLQEEDAAFLNRHRLSRHAPALPLYTRQDALHSLRLLRAQPWHAPFAPLPGWRAELRGAGHILGAASILLEVGGRRVLFSGDLGRPDDLLMHAPEPPPEADVVLVESTYGDRSHPGTNVLDELAPALARLAARGGVAVVPVFAVGRAQLLLHAIAQLKQQGRVPKGLPVYLDSPMALDATELFGRHRDAHRLGQEQLVAMARGTTLVRSVEESKALAGLHGPRVILSASGMATGGRVLHHLALHAGEHRNMVILTGHQAGGTRGARIAAGEANVRMLGRDVAIRAEVVQLGSASAHADGAQTLAWLSRMPGAPQTVYVVHGEPQAAQALQARIHAELGWRAELPEHGQSVAL
ncbi:MBL fold metallo-hydrolase RNA specificity domain-containing protein [Comamonas flocculans]|uniref:MBL fold metallo-hydrolase n=1 Tax=Comamonas flocculans TaxID=2597701 RepID=A0A5B8RV96_9BURK|nr:MBL fold metallo-hydrolase [Comamonas flocculans]QEA12688.1 MBL fold metallo-hydrolase [Comamonas flocculans]